MALLRRVGCSAWRRAWKDSPLSGRPKRLSFFFKREPTQRPHFPAKFKPEATFTRDVIDPFPNRISAGRGGAGAGVGMPTCPSTAGASSSASTSQPVFHAPLCQKTPVLSWRPLDVICAPPRHPVSDPQRLRTPRMHFPHKFAFIQQCFFPSFHRFILFDHSCVDSAVCVACVRGSAAAMLHCLHGLGCLGLELNVNGAGG